jgi:hypothetical protein
MTLEGNGEMKQSVQFSFLFFRLFNFEFSGYDSSYVSIYFPRNEPHHCWMDPVSPENSCLARSAADLY